MTTTFCRDSDNVYVNLSLANNGNNNFGLPIQAKISAAKTIPILDNPCDYYCSVIRFNIPLNYIPAVIMPIVPNQGNPNLSTLVFSMSNGGLPNTQNVIFIPSNNGPPTPIQNLSLIHI